MVYKVCGARGLLQLSDSAAAVAAGDPGRRQRHQLLDRRRRQPVHRPVELAFLDAYDAGVFVAASAGNSGPGAGTTDHRSPWVTTVAASTQNREFESTLTVTAGDGATRRPSPARRITAGVATPRPVVLSTAIAVQRRVLRDTRPRPASFAGKIVACQRGGLAATAAACRRASTSSQGGAAGMILYNPPLADTETDNHFLPAVHLADGTAVPRLHGRAPAASRRRSPRA